MLALALVLVWRVNWVHTVVVKAGELQKQIDAGEDVGFTELVLCNIGGSLSTVVYHARKIPVLLYRLSALDPTPDASTPKACSSAPGAHDANR